MARRTRTTSTPPAIEPSDDNTDFWSVYDNAASDLDLMIWRQEIATARRRPSFSDLKQEYAELWAEMAIRRSRLSDIDRIVARIKLHEMRYRDLMHRIKVPWYVIAVIHSLEASGRFDRHLHNGDPLSARTVNVPAGRPPVGTPPFTWEESAVDALQQKGLPTITDWSVEHLAYLFEGFNGWGYRLYHSHVKSPYLWGFCNHYTQGKYTNDGKWSETAVSQQCGAMVLLRRMHESGLVKLLLTSTQAEAAPVPQIVNVADAAVNRMDDDAVEDTVPEDAELIVRRLHPIPVDTQMTDGPGIYGYYDSRKRFGAAATVSALRVVGRLWSLRHSSPLIGVGDISLKGGGPIAGHGSHRTGRDVDMRPVRNDLQNGKITWRDAEYSRSLTQELVDLLHCNGVVQVKVVFFNDPNVDGRVNWPNHDNHLHVRFYFEDERPGYPELRLGSSLRPATRELQRRLIAWLASIGAPTVELDGVFGEQTLKSTEAFQTAHGIARDGVVGTDTWIATLAYILPRN